MLQSTWECKEDDIKSFVDELYHLLFKYDNKLSAGLIISELEFAKMNIFKELEQRIEYKKKNPDCKEVV